jgi:hypothetical protein
MAGEQIEAKAVELIGKLEALAPQVTEAALGAVRVEAAVWIVRGSIAGLVAFAVWIFAMHSWRRYKQSGDAFSDSPWGFSFFMMCVMGTIASLVSLTDIANPWTYAALNHPEVWLAKKALGL